MMNSLREWRPVIAIVALVLAALIWAVIYSADGRWQLFDSTEGGFRTEFPGTPRTERRQAQTLRGNATITIYMLRQPRHAATYLASFADYPPATAEEPDGDLLTETCNGFANQVGGKISETSLLTEDGYAGSEMWIESSRVGRVRLRVLVMERRVYMLAAYPVNRRKPRNVDHFFASFALTGEPAGDNIP
jgi:hypothetical protein